MPRTTIENVLFKVIAEPYKSSYYGEFLIWIPGYRHDDYMYISFSKKMERERLFKEGEWGVANLVEDLDGFVDLYQIRHLTMERSDA